MKTLLPAVLEFQPDVRQIDERRPHWLERATLYTLLTVIISAIIWASVAQVDEVVIAQGKLVTTAATIVVQPLETSVVRKLNAKVGDTVRKGESLAILDPTFSEADASQLRDKIASLNPQIARLEAMLKDQPYVPQQLDNETSLQLMIWTRAIEQHKAKLESFDQQALQTQAQMKTKSNQHQSLSSRLAVERELEGMRSYLLEKEIGSKVTYLEAKAKRLDIEREMQLAMSTRDELEQQVKRLQSDKAAYLAEFRQKIVEDLVQSRRDRDVAMKQLEKATLRSSVTVMTAPEDAIVLDVAQRSVGSVMKEAEPLYTLVPLDSPIEAEVSVEGRDVGRLMTGATTRVKLEAWPFQKHGTLTGEVRTISEDVFSPDAKKDPQQQAQQRPYYKSRIKLTSIDLRSVPQRFRLIPGMGVTAEIKVGERSVISYFLYPLIRGLDESIREP